VAADAATHLVCMLGPHEDMFGREHAIGAIVALAHGNKDHRMALTAAGAISPLVALTEAVPTEYSWESECDGCLAEKLIGRRFQFKGQEGDFCEACKDKRVAGDEALTDLVREMPCDIAGEALVALMDDADAREEMVELGAAGQLGMLLLQGSVFGKLVAIQALRHLVADEALSDLVLEEAGLGPIAVALGVAPAEVVVQREIELLCAQQTEQ